MVPEAKKKGVLLPQRWLLQHYEQHRLWEDRQDGLLPRTEASPLRLRPHRSGGGTGPGPARARPGPGPVFPAFTRTRPGPDRPGLS